jgi:O-antigen/teichoic acid export membrane protein
MDSLRSNAVRSFSWSALAKLVSQGATFAGTLLLARLLAVSDFGLVAMAQVYLGFLLQFIDGGFLHALIQRPKLAQRELAGAFWLLLVAGALGFGGSLLARPLLDDLFGAPGVGDLIAVLSSILLFLPFRTIAQAVLSWDVRVDEISKREAAVSVLRVVTSVVLALLGAGVWSLILPQVLAEMVFSLSVYHRAGWRLTWAFSLREMRPIFRYGFDISLSKIVWFAGARADQFIIGRLLGPGALGLYSLAWQFAGALPEFSTATLARVVFPVFSRLQEDLPRLKKAFLDVTRYTLLASLPAFAGLALVAPDLFALLLKPTWNDAILPLQLLCPVALLKMFDSLAGFLINARAATRRNLFLNAVGLVATVVGVTVGGTVGGLNGVVVGFGVSTVPVTLLFCRAALRECGGSVREWLARFVSPGAATAVMSAAVLATRATLPGAHHGLRLLAQVSVGVIAYAAVTLIVAPGTLAELRQLRQPRPGREYDDTPAPSTKLERVP